MASVKIDSGEFPLLRDIDFDKQPEVMKVYTAWSTAFHNSVPDAIDHLADVIEDVYSFEMWKYDYLDTPEEFFERVGIFGLDLEEPARLIKELRKNNSSKKAQIMRRTQKAKALREEGLTQQQIADEFGVSARTIRTDLSVEENSVITHKTSTSRKVKGYRITEYTKPETAAQKIVDIFGREFADELALIITKG